MTPEQLKKVCVYLAFFLLVSLAFNWFQYEAGRNKDLSAGAIKAVWEADKAINAAVIGKLTERLEVTDSAQHAKDSIHQVNNAAQKRTIAYYIRKERNSRPDTLTVTLQDTIYVLSANLVDSLENQIAGLKMTDSAKTVLNDSIKAVQARQIMKCDSLLDEALKIKPPSRWSLSLSAGPGGVYNPFNGRVHGGVIFGITTSYRINLKRNRK